jgi:enamine deaminase RidA (YjgF/YER057c/UK114 family)
MVLVINPWSRHMPNENAVIRYLNPPALERPPGYSHVVDVRGSRLIFIAGQAGVDTSGTVVGGDNIEAQADQAFRNLSAALESVGCNAANLVKLTVFVRDMKRLADYRRARDRFFTSVTPAVAPAVTLVEVSRLYSEHLLIEIEGIAAA